MRVTMKLWVLAFAFLVLAGPGSVYAEDAYEHWVGPGWYGTCDWGLDEDIAAGPFADEAACNADKPADDENCYYYCVYVDAGNLEDFEHYY